MPILNDFKYLDAINTYKPNYDNIVEGAEITYEVANSQFEMVEQDLELISRKMYNNELDKREIYAKCQNIVTGLALCCEHYLKALYLYEHKDDGKPSNELWSILEGKMNEDGTQNDGKAKDENGNTVYFRTIVDKNGNEEIICLYAKVDSLGNLIKDSKGRKIYKDKYGNEYDYKDKGKVLRTNGHTLNRLTNLMSPESKRILDHEMKNKPLENNEPITLYDMLQIFGAVYSTEYMSDEDYESGLFQHRNSFVDSRYPGQKHTDISVAYMYHFTTAIRNVVQFKMHPDKNQQIATTEKDAKNLPPEFKEFDKKNPNLLSDELLILIKSDENIKNKIVTLSSQQYPFLRKMSKECFCKMIDSCDISEIVCISHYWNDFEVNRYQIISAVAKGDLVRPFLDFLDPNNFIEYAINKKSKLSITINSEAFNSELEGLRYGNSWECYCSVADSNNHGTSIPCRTRSKQ